MDVPLPDRLVATLAKVHKPLRVDDFLRILALPRREKKSIEAALHAFVVSGEVIRLTGGGYTLASSLKTITGVVHLQRSGVGFVTPNVPVKGLHGDIFISQHFLGDAWNGDTVEVTLFPDKHGKSREGRITRVQERARMELAARVLHAVDEASVLADPVDSRISATFLTDVSTLGNTPPKQAIIRIKPEDKEGPNLWRATALAVLGDEATPAVQEELAKANHAIPDAFPVDALREAAAFPKKPGPETWEGRRDLTDIPFVTIDGDTARDFDDAIHVTANSHGHTLLVAIADVAHYVRPGTALDTEAFLRGNSYYFPLSVEPMLPEALSNELCSLKPGVPRLVMVAEIHFNAEGTPGKESFYPAVITSAGRLTYDAVREALENTPPAHKDVADALPMLKEAAALARILSTARTARGSLVFDIPEAECRFNNAGEIATIVTRESHMAHKLIEEFMVAANEAVARFLSAQNIPFLYRTHPAPDPDKLRKLFAVLAMTGLAPKVSHPVRGKNTPPSPHKLQALLAAAHGTPSEYLVGRTALRAMMQAGYTPENDGHYGLASGCYCHFTSPIRRYADLVVHRALKNALATPDATAIADNRRLFRIAEHINTTERTAMEAERETARRMATLFMRDKVGEDFDGVISGLVDFGIFVELRGVMTEGMIRLGDIRDDYYIYNHERQELRGERTGRTYRLGQAVHVRVTDVSMMRLEINLAFATNQPLPKPGKPGRRPLAKRGRKTR